MIDHLVGLNSLVLQTPATRGGSLRISLPCLPSPTHDSRFEHEVVLDHAWNLQTPHDLRAERIAGAFGGYCDCLTLIETGIPAAKRWLDLHLRRSAPGVWFTRKDGWTMRPALGCACDFPPGQDSPTLRFRRVEEAVSHATSAQHVAAQNGAHLRHVGPLAGALAAEWSGLVEHEQVDSEISSLVRDPDAAKALWEAGIHPRVAAELAAQIPDARGAVPLSYFVGMAYTSGYSGRDQDLRVQSDALLAAWLVWSVDSPEPSRPLAYAAWLGLPSMDRESSRVMLDAGYDSATADELAAASGCTPDHEATNLLGWAHLGCQPSVDQLLALGADRSAPPANFVQAVLEDAALASIDITRTEVALLLALVRRVEVVVDAVEAGVRTTGELRYWHYNKRNHS